MQTVAIIDYGMGNLDSVARAVEECGAKKVIAKGPNDLEGATHIILPGVGSFADGMRHLREQEFEAALSEQVAGRGKPFLGICLGMQLLAAKGSEGGDTQGLGWINGEVRRLEPHNPGERIPHIGWNEVAPSRTDPLFRDLPAHSDFYFVHSYHFVCEDSSVELGRTPYCGGFTSAVARKNVFGVQFHPEKSQKLGLRILRNFLSS